MLEEYLRQAELSAVVLRNNIYQDILPALVDPDGTIRGPAGRGRIAAVARADSAAAAAAVLTEPGAHDGAVYSLTGPQALSLSEVAETIGSAEGRVVRFDDQSVSDACLTRAAAEVPEWMLDGWVSTYTAIAAGELAEVTETVAALTGHRPASLPETLDQR